MKDLIVEISERLRSEIDSAFRDGRMKSVVDVLLGSVSQLSKENLSLQVAFVVVVRKRDAQRTPVAYRPIAVLTTSKGIAPPDGIEEASEQEIRNKINAALNDEENPPRNSVGYATFAQHPKPASSICPACGGSGLKI